MALCSDCKKRPTLGGSCTQCKECWDEEGRCLAEIYGRSSEQLMDDILNKLPAVNNHVCPSCGNDKVSKTEKSCWKCGGAL